MLKIKICGITNIEDAELAVRHGASALGFNFYTASPRYIAPASATEIIERLPNHVESIGVFVNSDLDSIETTAAATGINAIQLHGDESCEFVGLVLEKTGLEVIKAMRVDESFDPESVLHTGARTVLLDTLSQNEYGGTGKTFDWRLAREVCRVFPRVYLAGGLGPENISSAIAGVRPFGIDSCSALESSAGKKDPNKLARFLELAISAERRTKEQ